MAARKKKTTSKKAHYVRAKKRSGAGASVGMRRTVSIIFLLLIIGSVIFGICKGFEWINNKLYSKNPRFEMQHLVISSNGRLNEDYLRETSGLHEGMNLFEFSFSEIERKLQNVSLIESVYLERKLPHTLIMKVKERVPVAQITGRQRGSMPWMLDRYGYVLPPRGKGTMLPLISGLDADFSIGEQLIHKDIRIALDIIGICESSHYLSSYIDLVTLNLKYPDYIELYVKGERDNELIRVRMARFSLKPKLSQLASVIQLSRSQGTRLKTVDLTLDSAKVPATYY
ncbi:MAG TPA: FtsQ-type POTRA domain-containing protein [Pontiella sp.]